MIPASVRRHEVYVGGPTVKAIVGNMIAHGLLDGVLATRGYTNQLTDELEPPGRPDNLFKPVEDAHARTAGFEARSKQRSLELWTVEHVGTMLLGAGLLALIAGLGIGRRTAPWPPWTRCSRP